MSVDDVYSEMKRKARDAILQLIELEREGEQIDRTLLKNILGIFIEVGMSQMTCYQQDFESQLLKTTAEYYKRKAAVWIEEDSCPDYMVSIGNTVVQPAYWLHLRTKHTSVSCTTSLVCLSHQGGLSWPETAIFVEFVIHILVGQCSKHWLHLQIKAEDCLKLEEERVSKYMHQSSRTSLLKEVETEILQQHQTTLLEKEHSGCAALLQDDKVTTPAAGLVCLAAHPKLLPCVSHISYPMTMQH